MYLRFLSFLIMMVFITSCDLFCPPKSNNSVALDTIVDFSSVDTFPSFKECDAIIDKQEKMDCFRTTIHQKIGEELQQHPLAVKDSINEIVYVDVLINSEGIFSLDTIQASEKLKEELPELDSLLKASVEKLPKIYPANKRGIPVTTKYRLPIRIQLTE